MNEITEKDREIIVNSLKHFYWCIIDNADKGDDRDFVEECLNKVEHTLMVFGETVDDFA